MSRLVTKLTDSETHLPIWHVRDLSNCPVLNNSDSIDILHLPWRHAQAQRHHQRPGRRLHLDGDLCLPLYTGTQLHQFQTPVRKTFEREQWIFFVLGYTATKKLAWSHDTTQNPLCIINGNSKTQWVTFFVVFLRSIENQPCCWHQGSHTVFLSRLWISPWTPHAATGPAGSGLSPGYHQTQFSPASSYQQRSATGSVAEWNHQWQKTQSRDWRWGRKHLNRPNAQATSILSIATLGTRTSYGVELNKEQKWKASWNPPNNYLQYSEVITEIVERNDIETKQSMNWFSVKVHFTLLVWGLWKKKKKI